MKEPEGVAQPSGTTLLFVMTALTLMVCRTVLNVYEMEIASIVIR